MQKISKQAYFCALALLTTLALTVPAFALGTEYSHDSTGDLITVRQWATMLCGTYQKPGTSVSDSAACLTDAHRSGWLPVEAVMDPEARMCRGALYRSAFDMIGLPVYDYSLYPGGKSLTDYENCIRIGDELGLCPKNADPLELVTRGEAAALLHSVLTREISTGELAMLTEPCIQNDAGVNLDAFLLELRRVPEPILGKFQNKGWVYMVDLNYLTNLSERYQMDCIGAADYGAKRIYVSDASATLHEFGHFLDSCLGFPSAREPFYEEEARAASAFLWDYALTDCNEYFAEYFVYWVEHQSDEKSASQMRKLTPKTYEYFARLASNDWSAASPN